jgi:hypothetical protein
MQRPRASLPRAAGEFQSAANAFSQAADEVGASESFPVALPRIDESLRLISATVYILARDAVRSIADRNPLRLCLGHGRHRNAP